MTATHRVFDGLLVLQCTRGDKKAYSLLVKRWHLKLCRQAYWHIKDVHLAQDVAQESWVVIFKKLKTLNDPNSFGSWALSIVNRKAIDLLRKQHRTNESLDRYSLDQDKRYDQTQKDTVDTKRNASDNRTDVMLKAIQSLPESQQLVLRLFYLESYSIAEISKILKINKGTVKSRLFYAREKLKSIIKNRNHEKS